MKVSIDNLNEKEDFIFKPTPDITAYELAKIWEFVGIGLVPEVYETLDSELQRHFKQDQ